MRVLKQRWLRLNERRSGRGYGLLIDSPSDPLTNLRFADDIMLVAQSRSDASKMLADLAKEALHYGLEINLGKTKILTTEQSGGSVRSFSLNGDTVEVLALHASERYLGQKLSIGTPTTTEVEHRVATAWASFMKFKGELCSRHIRCISD